MLKRIMFLMFILVLVFSFISCSSNEDTTEKILNQELMKLLPDEGFTWAYIGPTYYHEMQLESILVENSEAIYKISGEVEDVSNGELNKNYNINLYYIVNNDSIRQDKTEETMLDSEFDSITLIKTPLEIGNNWSEVVKDNEGNKVTVVGEIIDIIETDNGTEYKVVYKDKKSDYSESRKIMEGYGVIAFTKAVEIEGEKFSYGYGLYGKNSGYLKSDEVSSLIDSEESNEIIEGSVETIEESEEIVEESGEINEEQIIRDTIKNFNDSWIEYVNNDDESFFDYVVLNGVAYKNAMNFNKDNLTEKFLKMEISSVFIDNNVATVKVYEEIEKNNNGDISIVKYNWLYNLVKKDGIWLVNGYNKQD